MSTVARFKREKEKMSRAEKSLSYKTYIGNTAEGQGFADKRKRKMVNQYRKIESKEKAELDAYSERVKKIYAAADDSSDEDCTPARDSKKSDKKRRKLSNETTVLNEAGAEPAVVAEQSNLSDLADTRVIRTPSTNSTSHKSKDVRATKKVSTFHREEKEWSEKKLEQQKRQEEMEKREEERKIKTAVYKKEKKQKYKQLLKRNYKGQPNMESRMKLLLEKIKKQK